MILGIEEINLTNKLKHNAIETNLNNSTIKENQTSTFLNNLADNFNSWLEAYVNFVTRLPIAIIICLFWTVFMAISIYVKKI